MGNIAIIYFDAASGHRSAALALQKAFQNVSENEVRVINLPQALAPLPWFQFIVKTGINIFNDAIKKDKFLDLGGLINLSHFFTGLVGSRGIKKLSKFWGNFKPDVLISVTPMYNPVLFKSALLINPELIYFTIPVDFQERKRNYWFNKKLPIQYILGTDYLVDRANQLKINPNTFFQVSGMIQDPDSYENVSESIDYNERSQINPNLKTVFLSFGGQGTIQVLKIAQLIASNKIPVNLIIMCGKNEDLYHQVSQINFPYPVIIKSYTKETPIAYIQLSDIVIGKPGAMTIAEAIICKKPILCLKSTGLRLVQKDNEKWLSDNKIGLVARNYNEIIPCLNLIINSYSNYLKQVSSFNNNAIFESIDIILQTLNNKKHAGLKSQFGKFEFTSTK